jgi:hypothetical protein
MLITADLTNLSNGVIIANGCKFPVSCNVRTLKNGTRGKAVKEVRYCIPDGLPYDPLPFPKGLWNITGVEWQKDFGFDKWEYGSVKIRTDAFQMVNVWELDKDGNYWRPTDKWVKDYGYLIHFSESLTTLGCIRGATDMEMITLGKFVQEQLKKEKMQIEVI